MRHKILIATTNPGKVAELKAMLDVDVEWVSLADFKDIAQVEEDGATFAENARKKALGYARQIGLWTIADDSGLVVDALGGAPGIESARYADTKSNDRKLIDRQNIEKLLKVLQDVPAEKRKAKFICHLCLASPEKILLEAQGVLEGLIADQPAGEFGFGYDPIFFVPRLNKTVAQLPPQQKNAISHRAQAIKKLKPLLFKFLKNYR